MAAEFYKNIPIFDPDSVESRDALHPKDAAYGLVPRDYTKHPREMFEPASEAELIPQSDWDPRYDEQEKTESSLEHMYLRGGKPAWVNLDQNGDGDCWAYSTGQAKMFASLKSGSRVPRLNPHFIATYAKTFNGGWCGLSAKVAADVGCAEEGTGPGQWKLHSHRTGDLTQEVLDAAAKHKTVEEYRDLTRQAYDQRMTSLQIATCSFMNIAVPSDFNWWGHSVCCLRWVRIAPGDWGALILNSWKGWGRFGLAVLRGSKAIADGAVAVRTVVQY